MPHHRSAEENRLGARARGGVDGKIAPAQAKPERGGGPDRISPPARDGIGMDFRIAIVLQLHRGEVSRGSSRNASDARMPCFAALPPQAVALGGQARICPSLFQNRQGKELVPGEDRGVARVQTRDLRKGGIRRPCPGEEGIVAQRPPNFFGRTAAAGEECRPGDENTARAAHLAGSESGFGMGTSS